ncbi:hypothetical protein QV65_25110 [Rhodococcus erythropolis]|nr:hypothetical protein QV65_25110 [Rhodococcus erythropolis]
MIELNSYGNAVVTGRLLLAADPGEAAVVLKELAGHLDGVHFHPLVIDEDLPVLAKLVLPALSKSGSTRRPVPGSTLRATSACSGPQIDSSTPPDLTSR